MQVRGGALRQKDVKNEGRTVYVYENTTEWDKMYIDKPGFVGRKCTGFAIIGALQIMG